MTMCMHEGLQEGVGCAPALRCLVELVIQGYVLLTRMPELFLGCCMALFDL